MLAHLCVFRSPPATPRMDLITPATVIDQPPAIGPTSSVDPSLRVTRAYEQFADRLLNRIRARLPSTLTARTDPEDVVQSVFRRLIAHYGQGGYSAPDGNELWRLLLTIAMNKIRDEDAYHRARRRDIRRTRSANADFADEIPDDPGDTLLRLVIEELIAPLSADRRTAVELRLEGHDFAEIAAKVGRSKRTIERYLQEFRDRLGGTLA